MSSVKLNTNYATAKILHFYLSTCPMAYTEFFYKTLHRRVSQYSLPFKHFFKCICALNFITFMFITMSHEIEYYENYMMPIVLNLNNYITQRKGFTITQCNYKAKKNFSNL